MQLGELEKQVLQYLWATPNVDAKQVHAELVRSRSGSLNTIQSTLDRLFKKGLLSREKRSHAYVYHAKVAREDLIARLIFSVTDDFISSGESSLVAAFSSVSAALDEDQLDELEQLIERQRSLLKQEKAAC
jgi:predicted transcriptional regulator